MTYPAVCHDKLVNQQKDLTVMFFLTFTRGWAPRPISISFTSAGPVSITENIVPIAGVVGC